MKVLIEKVQTMRPDWF